VYHSTLGWRVMKKKKKISRNVASTTSKGVVPNPMAKTVRTGIVDTDQFRKTPVALSLRLKDLLGPVTRVKKKKKKTPVAAANVYEETSLLLLERLQGTRNSKSRIRGNGAPASKRRLPKE